jgi:hypothetical protein
VCGLKQDFPEAQIRTTGMGLPLQTSLENVSKIGPAAEESPATGPIFTY